VVLRKKKKRKEKKEGVAFSLRKEKSSQQGVEGGWFWPSDALRSLCRTADPHSGGCFSLEAFSQSLCSHIG
jgi:hypothetical protein